MLALLLIALLQPGAAAPPKPADAKVPGMQPQAVAALRGLVRRCVGEARTAATSDDIGSTAYFLTFDQKGRVAAIDFLIDANATRTPFQACMTAGLQPWTLLEAPGKTLRMGWPSFTTPNPNPPQMPRRPWHVVKPKHVCPATGVVSAACVTADGRRIRGPRGKLGEAVLTVLRRYHHIEGVSLHGEDATALWRTLQRSGVEPNRVDVRESSEPLQVRIHAWRGLRLKLE